MQSTSNVKRTKTIARTALGIALVVIAQLFGKLIPPIAVILGPFSISQLITGTLVNCILLVFTIKSGILSGALIGALSAFLAGLIGIGPIVPAITPVVACGNIIFVVAYWFICEKLSLNRYFALIIGSSFKCAALWSLVPVVMTLVSSIPEKQASILSIMFSWPQGVTAVLGGLVAFVVLKPLNKATKKQ